MLLDPVQFFEPPLSGVALGAINPTARNDGPRVRRVAIREVTDGGGLACYDLHHLAAEAYKQAFNQRAFAWPDALLMVVAPQRITPENDAARELIAAAMTAQRLLEEAAQQALREGAER